MEITKSYQGTVTIKLFLHQPSARQNSGMALFWPWFQNLICQIKANIDTLLS